MNISETECFGTETWPGKNPATEPLLAFGVCLLFSTTLLLYYPSGKDKFHYKTVSPDLWPETSHILKLFREQMIKAVAVK